MGCVSERDRDRQKGEREKHLGRHCIHHQPDENSHFHLAANSLFRHAQHQKGKPVSGPDCLRRRLMATGGVIKSPPPEVECHRVDLEGVREQSSANMVRGSHGEAVDYQRGRIASIFQRCCQTLIF